MFLLEMIPINKFDIESINGKLIATNFGFGEFGGKDVDFNKCFATREECLGSGKRNYKIVELPKKKTIVGAGVIIELNDEDMI